MLDKTTTNGKPMKAEKQIIHVKLPARARAKIKVIGESLYMSNKFSTRKMNDMIDTQKAGSAGKKTRKAKPPKNFEQAYKETIHVSKEGWYGIPTGGFRSGMIDACRSAEVDMIRAKMCIRIIPDGYDEDNGQPLVRIYGKPKMNLDRVRVGINSTDIAARGMFEDWYAIVTIDWNDDVFKARDIANLLAIAGTEVGVGAGRQLSRSSAGLGYGFYRVKMEG